MLRTTVVGDAKRIRECVNFLSQKYATVEYQIAIFSSVNFSRSTTLVQVRKLGGLAGRSKDCSTLRMTEAEQCIKISAYDDIWYDRDDVKEGCIYRFLRKICSNENEDSGWTQSLYNDAVDFFRCKVDVDSNKSAKCGTECVWNEKQKAPCQNVCRANALTWTGNGMKVDKEKCTNCGECLKVCKHGTLVGDIKHDVLLRT